MSSAVCFKLDQSKILLSGNGLIPGVYISETLHMCNYMYIVKAFV